MVGSGKPTRGTASSQAIACVTSILVAQQLKRTTHNAHCLCASQMPMLTITDPLTSLTATGKLSELQEPTTLDGTLRLMRVGFLVTTLLTEWRTWKATHPNITAGERQATSHLVPSAEWLCLLCFRVLIALVLRLDHVRHEAVVVVGTTVHHHELLARLLWLYRELLLKLDVHCLVSKEAGTTSQTTFVTVSDYSQNSKPTMENRTRATLGL